MTSGGDHDPNSHLRPTLPTGLRVRVVRLGNDHNLAALRVIDGGSNDYQGDVKG